MKGFKRTFAVGLSAALVFADASFALPNGEYVSTAAVCEAANEDYLTIDGNVLKKCSQDCTGEVVIPSTVTSTGPSISILIVIISVSPTVISIALTLIV